MSINFEARIWLWEHDPSDIEVWVYELEPDHLDGNAKWIKDELEKLDLRSRFLLLGTNSYQIICKGISDDQITHLKFHQYKVRKIEELKWHDYTT